jgi:hypothetical protein
VSSLQFVVGLVPVGISSLVISVNKVFKMDKITAKDGANMKPVLTEVLPKNGLVYSEKGSLSAVLCKPKIMPIKSIALQKEEERNAAAEGEE